MSLKSLVLCADEKIVRVLRRVLSDLDIGIEHCTDPDGAIHKLTRQRFEAIIIDCTDLKTATSVLKSARSAPANKRAIAVAIMDGHTGLRSAFDMGAHFVLYKPVSTERAKSPNGAIVIPNASRSRFRLLSRTTRQALCRP
jgi:DNA-binding NtrC family response regulator